MINVFQITTSQGIYRCPVRLVCPIGVLSALTFAYDWYMPETPVSNEIGMYQQEYITLAAMTPSPTTIRDDDNWANGTFVATEVLARTAVMTKLQAVIATYETWPHTIDGPYTP